MPAGSVASIAAYQTRSLPACNTSNKSDGHQGALPAGVTLNAATGALTGTPTSAGAFNFTVRVGDRASLSTTKQFTIQIAAGLTVTTAPSLTGGVVGAPYSHTLEASGGTAPYTWSISAGSLPPGVTLSATAGVLAGTPSATGTFNFTALVTDRASVTANKQFTIAISTRLAISTPAALPNGAVGVQYAQSLAVSGGTPPYSWSLESGTLPTGLTLDPSTGEIRGTPASAGTFTFTAAGADSVRSVVSRSFTLSVSFAPVPAVSIVGLPDAAEPAQQPAMELSLASTYPVPITGQITLAFESDAAVRSDDPAIQFSTGGRTVNFSIPPDSTRAVFPVPQLAIQTGTVAGTITLNVELQAADTTITPSPAPNRSIRVNSSVPRIRSVTVTRSGSGFEVRITGFSPTREISQATFWFTPAAGSDLQTTQLNQPLADLARRWFQDTASSAFGSQFTLVYPFNVQGNASAIASVSVSLTNSQGASTPVSANF